MVIRVGSSVVMQQPALTLNATRLDALDAVRGLAMVWMTLFHLSFDLNQFGHWRQDFYNDPFWTWQRTL
ncbi:heparan-alpha-glucosaminide N-acetyltransferase domain-containing protein, partial [Salmonella enterica]|uniref:heparan-alpha-glucosaminide N-acetyltransferase domain-containing protein n=1 Tax=Salmonella enterica TaxID=28901 RepID=UPI003F4B59FD